MFGISFRFSKSAHAIFYGVLLLSAGCTTVPPAQVETFHQGVSSAKLQMDTAFASINQLVTEDEIDRATTLQTIDESDIIVVLDADDIGKWDNALSKIEQYAANLSLLLSPDNANNFGTATENLAAQLAKTDANAVPSGAISTAFAELSRILIQVKEQHDAIEVARTADPGVQAVFQKMEDAIGATSDTGLRGTARSHWDTRFGIQINQFQKAQQSAKRAIVTDLISLRDQRDAQDLQLEMLRQSFINLGTAHAALARGSMVDLNGAIALVQQELAATRALADKFNSIKPKS
jgi:hypothetical protein